MNFFKEFDYIIVGAGTAGCLLANRLSRREDVSVLLIEAGGSDNYPWIHIPVGYLYCINNPRTDWCYKTEKDSGIAGRNLIYPRGKVLGGSSSINGMIYMRGQKNDYDDWAKITGDNSWSWENVLPFFIKTEDYYSGENLYHGSGGEWRVEKQRLKWEILEAFREAAFETGIPKIDDFNKGNNEGSSYFEVNQKKGIRWNAAKAFLKNIKDRKNLIILTKSHVNKLLIEDNNNTNICKGVEFVINNEKFFAISKKETILSAGSVGSPKILQLSGVGPQKLLLDNGIKVKVNSPGVGENLQDHLQLRMAFQVKGVKTLNTMYNSFIGKALIGLEYLFNQSGPMSMAPSQLGVFAKSNSFQKYANLQYHIQPLSLEKFGDPLHKFPAFTASVCNLKPTSRGSIKINGNNFFSSPKIFTNYLSTKEDQEIAVESLNLTRKIISSKALRKYQPVEFLPGNHYKTNEELIEAAGEIGTTIFHPVGTCKMGSVDDKMAVVDSKLNLIGVKKLKVVDGSVMPKITSGNTNSPIIMIAEKAANSIINGF